MKIQKNKKTFRQKIADKIVKNLQPYIANNIKEHDNWLVDKIIHRIEFLSIHDDCTIQSIIDDLKLGGYKDD